MGQERLEMERINEVRVNTSDSHSSGNVSSNTSSGGHNDCDLSKDSCGHVQDTKEEKVNNELNE